MQSLISELSRKKYGDRKIKDFVEVFVPGDPTPQPRDQFRTLLPRMDLLARAPEEPRKLWHWLQRNCRAASRGVPKEHRVHKWKLDIREAVCSEMNRQNVLQWNEETPLCVEMVFCHRRPKSKTRKTNARYWHAQTPDFDNMAKAVCDGLNEWAWTDDAIVCFATAIDFTAGDGDRSGLAIRISELPSRIDLDHWAERLISVGEKTTSLFESKANGCDQTSTA